MEKRIKRLEKCFFLTLGVLGAASLTGCAEDVSALFGSDGTAVEVVPSFSQREKVITRGADNLDNGTSGFSNTSAGVCVKVDQNDNNYQRYQYTIKTGGKAVTPPASGPTFPSGGTSVNVYGWYPYNSGNTSFTIQGDQKSDANYCLSDLMLADKAVCSRNLSTGVVTAAALSFRHVMAKVKVVLNPQSGITVSAVKLKNVLPTVNINESNVSALTVGSASGTATDVILLSGGSITSSSTTTEKTLCGVFPEQTFTSDFLVVTAKTSTGSNTDITYSFTGAGKTFENNNEYVVNLSISPQSLEENEVSLEEWQTAGNNPVNISGGGGKAPTLGETTKTLKYGVNGTFSVSGPSGATAWTAITSNSSIATASVSSGTVTVTPTGIGSCDIFVYPTSGVTSAFSTASCAVTVNKGDAALTLNKTSLTISGLNTTETFTVTRQEAAGTITAVSSNTSVATTSVAYSGNVATVTVTGKAVGSSNITVTKDDGTLYGPYTTTDKVVAVTVKGYPITPANSKVGDIIASDGKAYAALADLPSGVTAVAIVAYKGDGESSTGTDSYNHGLALSMEDLTSGADTQWRSSGSGTDLAVQYTSITSECLADLNGLTYTNVLIGKGANYPAAQKISDYRTSCSVPSGCSDWFLPTIGQWNLILKGLTNSSTNLSTSTNNTYKGSNINTILEGFGGASARMKSDSGYFWSSTETNTDRAWDMYFNGGNADHDGKAYKTSVRAVLAF